MGLKGAQEVLTRRLRDVFTEPDVDVYVDNAFGYSNDLDEVISTFGKALSSCAEANLKVNIGDCEIGATVAKILGYESSLGSYSPGERMTRALRDMRRPKDQVELISLLASANVIRRFVDNFNDLIGPFSGLVKRNAEWSWTPAHETAFVRLKETMTSDSVLAPFSPSLETRVYCDYNGSTERRTALGASLWQKQISDGLWRPVGYASRYLSQAENRLIFKESALSSSVGECLGVAFCLKYFYNELSQIREWEVLADCKNLLYWRTSAAPLMVNIRATIAGLYDLSRIKIRHIPRSYQFADVLGRLASHTPPEDYNGFDDSSLTYREFAFPGADLLENSSSASTDPRPDGYQLEEFSEGERKLMKESSQTYHTAKNQPVTRKIHGRQLFVVPASRVDDVFLEAHLDASTSSHLSFSATRAALAHLHWPKKLSTLRRLHGDCECQHARGPRGFKPITMYTGQAARPGQFAEVVYFDQKSFPTHRGRQYLGTWLDKATGLFGALRISGPTGAEARRQVEAVMTLGVCIGAAIFDAHASYLRDEKFRRWLAEVGVAAYFSKGNDPTFIADLERAHRELNERIRSLADPWSWVPELERIVFLINSAPSDELAGASRGGMALGHSPADARAIARRFKTLRLAERDSVPPGPLRFAVGDKVLLAKKFASQLDDRSEIVTIKETDHSKSLIIGPDMQPRFVSNRLLKAISKMKPPAEPERKAAVQQPAPAPAVDLEEKYAMPQLSDGDADSDPAPAEDLVIGEWAAILDGVQPWLGKISAIEKDGQIWIDEYRFVDQKGLAFPVWRDQGGRTRVAKSCPRNFKIQQWLVQDASVIASEPSAHEHKPPISVLKSLAEAKRDPLQT